MQLERTLEAIQPLHAQKHKKGTKTFRELILFFSYSKQIQGNASIFFYRLIETPIDKKVITYVYLNKGFIVRHLTLQPQTDTQHLLQNGNKRDCGCLLQNICGS